MLGGVVGGVLVLDEVDEVDGECEVSGVFGFGFVHAAALLVLVALVRGVK